MMRNSVEDMNECLMEGVVVKKPLNPCAVNDLGAAEAHIVNSKTVVRESNKEQKMYDSSLGQKDLEEDSKSLLDRKVGLKQMN